MMYANFLNKPLFWGVPTDHNKSTLKCRKRNLPGCYDLHVLLFFYGKYISKGHLYRTFKGKLSHRACIRIMVTKAQNLPIAKFSQINQKNYKPIMFCTM